MEMWTVCELNSNCPFFVLWDNQNRDQQKGNNDVVHVLTVIIYRLCLPGFVGEEIFGNK